ncbi:hypothetical protein YC2023_003125 [Brassica napus]
MASLAGYGLCGQAVVSHGLFGLFGRVMDCVLPRLHYEVKSRPSHGQVVAKLFIGDSLFGLAVCIMASLWPETGPPRWADKPRTRAGRTLPPIGSRVASFASWVPRTKSAPCIVAASVGASEIGSTNVHTDVRVCPSAHTGRPWPSVSTHRTSGCPSVHISARSVDCSGDFGPRGLSVQYTQDVRQHTQDVRGCPCVSVCPSVHTGRPSAHAGRPSAHAGRPWLSVCLRVSVSAHRTSVSTHRTSVSTRRTSVSTRRTSVAVRVCPCVRQCTQDVRQHTQDVRQHTQDVRGCPCVSVCPSAHAGRPSAHAGRPSAHAGRPCLSVSTHRLSVD